MAYTIDMGGVSMQKQIKRLRPDLVQHVEAVLTSDKAKSVATNVLLVAGTVGVLGLAFTMPNALKLLSPFLRRKYKRPLSAGEQREKVAKVFYYLKESGQIHMESTAEGLVATLTEKGTARFNRLRSEVRAIARPKQWDGKWWLVAADIPTKTYRIAADMFRLKLRELCFYPLQRTLWLHPFNPSRELEYIVAKYGIGKFVTLMEINRLDTEDKKNIIRYFKLKHLL